MRVSQEFLRDHPEHGVGRFQYREAGPSLLHQVFPQRASASSVGKKRTRAAPSPRGGCRVSHNRRRVPRNPMIYHIVHGDRLKSIIHDGALWCDDEAQQRNTPGTTIGMPHIKARRRMKYLSSHPDLTLGRCVPFYFCARSVMLYLIHMRNHEELSYRGGQDAIVHLQATLLDAVEWAEDNHHRWAFTTSNAAAGYSADYADIESLGEIDWTAVAASNWTRNEIKAAKQAEFLMERSFPWTLVQRIGVRSKRVANRVREIIDSAPHKPMVQVQSQWYY